MRSTTTQKLAELQRTPANIRNICILAHVDHGKTTLADTLVASNGIISQRMAGKLRYLDSREDEQLRGITMKSSAISLHYQHESGEYLVNLIDSPGHIDFSSEVSTAVRLCDGAIVLVDVVEGVCPQTHAVLRQAWIENIKPVLVLNKVDRLITELKMAPLEAHLHLTQILEQVNAITGELFTSQVLEKSSAKTTAPSSLSTAADQIPATADQIPATPDQIPATPDQIPATADQIPATADQIYDWSSGLEETDDSSLYFSPDQGNVLFASAVHGWGFGIQHFAELFAKKLGFKSEVLLKTLWGDFYLESKTKRIRKGANAKGKKPLFVQFILENLWAVYEAVLVRRDRDMIDKIVKSMNLKIQARDNRHSDPLVHLQAITSQWLPLSKAVLAMVTQCLPSPLDVNSERAEKLLCSTAQRFDSLPPETQKLKDDYLACSPSDDAPVIVYVSKMFTVDKKALPKNKQRPLTAVEMAERRDRAKQRLAEKLAGDNNAAPDTGQEMTGAVPLAPPCAAPPPGTPTPPDTSQDQVFIAFSRVFSGTVRSGATLYVLGPKHDPAAAQEMLELHGGDQNALASLPHVQKVTVGDLYMFMGKELEAMEEVPAGNILGIGGLESHIIKSATLASTVMCPAFTDMFFEAAPILKVALEPVNPGDVQRLVEGLKLLNQSDPCVRVSVQVSGEHVIMAAGEVHLQKCLDDLKDRYAKVEVNVSEPQVPFRETIVAPPTVDNVNEVIEGQVAPQRPLEGDKEVDDRLVQLQTRNKKCTVKVSASPLPAEITEILDKNATLIKTLDLYTKAKFSTTSDHNVNDDANIENLIKQSTLSALREFKTSLTEAFKSAGDFWESAVDQIWSFGPKRNGPNILLNRVPSYQRHSVWSCLDDTDGGDSELWDFDNSIVSGFQMVTLSGPLCAEPMRGVCFVIEDWDMDQEMRLRERKVSERERTISEHRSRTISGMFSEESEEEDLEAGSDEDSDEEDTTQQLKHLSLDDEKEEVIDTPLEAPTKRDVASYGPFSGQLMSCVKEGCRRAFSAQPQRLMAAMYSCNIQATADVLGKLYGVLGKRNGRVLEEDLKEGTSVFDIAALIPVIESFGFTQELRKKTSGLANPLLKFSHWEVLDLDPFWVPTTEEEYLHYGEKADNANIALGYMNRVRRQKGLYVDEKIVESGEKQRTRSRKK